MTFDIKPLVVPGSPQWWSTRPPRVEKSGGRGRPSLSFDRIIEVALEAVDEVGPQAFNMRMLADRLASGTATLYRHFDSRDEILAYVLDRVIGELPVDEAAIAGLTWQQACLLLAAGIHQMLNAHPKMAPLLASQIPMGPNGLRARERGISLLMANGFPPELAAKAYVTLVHYVIGFAIQQHASGGGVLLDSDERKELRRFFASLDPKVFPSTVKLAKHLAEMPVDEEFHFGLQLIIDGLEIARSPKDKKGKKG